MSPVITLLRVTLTLRTPGGVTAPELDDAIHLPLARGPRHRGEPPYVPPSSLAGALRAHLGPAAIRFLGPPPGASDLTPSPVRLLGSDVALPDDAEPVVVHSTAIDPHRGAAAVSTLRSRQLLPAATRVRVYLRCDDPALAGDLVPQLRRWEPVIGRGRTTGHGQAAVTQIAVRRLDLRTRDGLQGWLSGTRDGLFPDDDAGYDSLTGPDPTEQHRPWLTADFQIVDALVIGADKTGTRSNARPIYRQDGAPAVPGSAWKGVLRSRCTYILRSCGASVCPAGQPCGECPICRLFGYTTRGAAPGTATGHAGTLTFDTAVITRPDVAVRNHVAIDRFTGGARPGLLYSHEAVTAGTVRLAIHSRQQVSNADRGLILLAIRDLHDGLIGLGAATTRGFGTLRLTALLDELAPCHPTGDSVRALLTTGAA